jgi:glycerate 2-kinase
VPDPTTRQDALDILRRYGIELPAAARAFLDSPEGESVKPGDPRLAGLETHLIATPQMALEAAAEVAKAAGVTPVMLGDTIEGEAKDVGKVFAGITHQIATRGLRP